MNKATFIPAVTETKTVEVSPAKVILELTTEEASTLRDVCAKVGGYPNGRRGHMAAIASALDDAGIKRPPRNVSRGGLDFLDGFSPDIG